MTTGLSSGTYQGLTLSPFVPLDQSEAGFSFTSLRYFGRGTKLGDMFRKKMLELVTLGCAATMAIGTPIESIKRNNQFVTFKAYKSGKKGMALAKMFVGPDA